MLLRREIHRQRVAELFTVVVSVSTVVIVVIVVSIARVRHAFFLGPVQDLVELASVEPDTSTAGAVVNLDSRALSNL
jgi:hypothetical protein